MRKHFIIIFLLLLGPYCFSQAIKKEPSYNKFVNTFIGTAASGNTYPGATVPFGMVQLSPDDGISGDNYCSGYNYSDRVIVGFSHTHLSGTGVGDLLDILFMPAVLNLKSNDDLSKLKNLHSIFSHDDETASPGYYSVLLKTFNIKAELTATKRAGFQKYIFPHSKNAVVVLNLGHKQNRDYTTGTYIKVINNSTIVGYRKSTGWTHDQRVYFAAKFSQPFKSVIFNKNNHIIKHQPEEKGINLEGIFLFNTEKENKILLKVGLSSANIEGAVKDLNAEIPGWNFNKIKNEAAESWEKQLSKIKIETPSKELKTVFYSALYHSLITPNLFSDLNGNYKGADSLVHKAKGYDQYTVFSLWDTFRAVHPLFNIIERSKVNDFVKSLLAHFHQTGVLPKWELEGNEAHSMIGYYAVAIIADAILKGFHGFNIEEAYKAMKVTAMKNHSGIKYFRKIGFIPVNKVKHSVSRTLAYAYDDWCIAQVAKYLHKQNDYKYFIDMSKNYKNIFDKTTGFMRGKFADGKWVTPFRPNEIETKYMEYTEGNAWQWTWFVPQDITEIVSLMGGKERFNNKLDSMFVKTPMLISGHKVPKSFPGVLGQYYQGNEPDQQVPYLYNYSGQPWKTQKVVRYICEKFYKDSPAGLPGNDDCGQMSAWYVFSSIGFYPVNPADDKYMIGSPMFQKSVINVKHGKTFSVIANNVSIKNQYIQSAELNGKKFDRTYITYKEIMHGGKLIFNMGAKPNKNWGVNFAHNSH